MFYSSYKNNSIYLFIYLFIMHEAAKQTHTQANTLNLTYYHNLRNSGRKITTMDNAKNQCGYLPLCVKCFTQECSDKFKVWRDL